MGQYMFGEFGARNRDERAESTDAVISVLDEAVALNLRLRAVSEDLHDHSQISGAMRGVLRDLKRYGSQTVPQIARRRPVTRQHIQAIVNDLFQMGFVEFVDNPAHKRSKLVQMTTTGEKALDNIVSRESAVVDQVDLPVSVEELESARRVLVTIREALERNDVRRLAGGRYWREEPWDDVSEYRAEQRASRTRAGS